MAERVSMDDFTERVLGIFDEFTTQTIDELNEEVLGDEGLNKYVSVMEKHSIRHGEGYAKSWKASRDTKLRGVGKINGVTIHSPKKYRVVHLLEKGAVRATKGTVTGDGHVAAAFEEIKRNVIQKIGG